MWQPEAVTRALVDRGELWEAAPGLVGLRGDALALYRQLEHALACLALAETDDEWQVPAGISFVTLARADYFASFPQWLTGAAHLASDAGLLEGIATDRDPASAARNALTSADAALAPAVCYHIYERLAGRTLVGTTLVTAQATCWRHEGAQLATLERGWAFTMRELVCLGTGAAVEAFRQRGLGQATALAAALGLHGKVVQASDPFFAPTARGKALLQQVKALKQELVLPLGKGRSRGIAAASFNHHESFFGNAFDIGLASGEAAASGCVAFGIERWLLAFLVAHGPDARRWPAVEPLPVRTLGAVV